MVHHKGDSRSSTSSPKAKKFGRTPAELSLPPLKKVLVGMSGGVDSSVAALLLKRAGFNVAGAYMKCWDYDAVECTGAEDEKAARMAAAHIGIPFYVFDFRKEYKKKVFDYFLREYKAGRTPNPDVMCNRYIKFGIFFERAMELGFDYVATGHYVRVKQGRLLKGRDKNKDQSYFLAFVKPEILSRTLFPLGNYTKEQVREIARGAKLLNAERPDSQGLCFVGDVKMGAFLKKYLKSKPGLIMDESGKTLGFHQGLWFYTIGQRKGIELPGGPYYVLRKDMKRNVLIVTKDEKNLLKKELVLRSVNWFYKTAPAKSPDKLKVMIRYRQKPVSATITNTLKSTSRLFTKEDGEPYTLVRFSRPQRAITPGQVVVFYRNQELLGGGVIVS